MGEKSDSDDKSSEVLKLPEPEYEGGISVERALLRRRSARHYRDEPLTLVEVSQLLWAAQGTNSSRGFRTAPSAGATYPLEVYLVAGAVSGLAPGIYEYRGREHGLLKMVDGDVRAKLCVAAMDQRCVREGAASIVIAAVYERTTRRYGERGFRYVHMEAGHVQQNVHLQAISLNIGTVVIGAFYDNEVKRALNLPDGRVPLGIMPLGRIR